jgi:hypothetical protein
MMMVRVPECRRSMANPLCSSSGFARLIRLPSLEIDEAVQLLDQIAGLRLGQRPTERPASGISPVAGR